MEVFFENAIETFLILFVSLSLIKIAINNFVEFLEDMFTK